MSHNRPFQDRRHFLKQVGNGMMIAGIGPMLAADCGFAPEWLSDDDGRFDFGNSGPLVSMMQETEPAALQGILVAQLNSGKTNLQQLIKAAALANAETFGGEDYVGYHAEMALVPALRMSELMPPERQSLPVLKVLYRNTDRIQNVGGKNKVTLRPLESNLPPVKNLDQKLVQATRDCMGDRADELFVQTQSLPLAEKLSILLPLIEDDIDVHRFVLAHRAVELVDIVGDQHAQMMLRQCVRHCVHVEKGRIEKGRSESPIRKLLPKLMDQYKLDSIELGDRDPGVGWVRDTSEQIYQRNKFEASELVAGALADGISPEVVGETITLAANQLVLRQGPEQWRTHGASAGVHGTDAANAWRNIIRQSAPRHQAAGLIVSAFHTAKYIPFEHEPYPTELHREKVKAETASELLGVAEEAIRANDQPTAAAAVYIYGENGFAAQPVFNLMLKYAVSEDGRLHAEKYFHTVREEFASTRPELRWRHLVALGRVTASAFGYSGQDEKGYRAPGYEDACKLLGVKT